jgi:hypothetical protein
VKRRKATTKRGPVPPVGQTEQPDADALAALDDGVLYDFRIVRGKRQLVPVAVQRPPASSAATAERSGRYSLR